MADKLISIPFSPVPGIQSIGQVRGDCLAVSSSANDFAITHLLTGTNGPDRHILVAIVGQDIPNGAKYIGSTGGLVVFEL